MPSESAFTIRVTAEVLESNGKCGSNGGVAGLKAGLMCVGRYIGAVDGSLSTGECQTDMVSGLEVGLMEVVEWGFNGRYWQI